MNRNGLKSTKHQAKDLLPINHDSLKTAIKASNGNLTKVAKLLGCDRTTIYYHLRKSQELTDYLEEIRQVESDSLLDEALLKLKARVVFDDWRAIQYVLDTKGHERGYTRHQKVDEDVTFRIVREDARETD